MPAQLQVCGVFSPESILRRAAISSTVAGHTADTRLLKSMRCLAALEVWWGLAEGRDRIGEGGVVNGTIYGLLCSSTRGCRQRELLNLGRSSSSPVGDTCCRRGRCRSRPARLPACLSPEGRIVYMVLSLVV